MDGIVAAGLTSKPIEITTYLDWEGFMECQMNPFDWALALERGGGAAVLDKIAYHIAFCPDADADALAESVSQVTGSQQSEVLSIIRAMLGAAG